MVCIKRTATCTNTKTDEQCRNSTSFLASPNFLSPSRLSLDTWFRDDRRLPQLLFLLSLCKILCSVPSAFLHLPEHGLSLLPLRQHLPQPSLLLLQGSSSMFRLLAAQLILQISELPADPIQLGFLNKRARKGISAVLFLYAKMHG